MCKTEKHNSVAQQNHPALILLAAQPEFFARQGSVDASCRRRGRKTYGPYYRLRYREGHSSRSVYLGVAGPLVDRVRNALHVLQTPLRQHRAFRALFRQVRDALRIDRRHVDAKLRGLGLRLKGFEVRGWRTSPLHTLTRGIAPFLMPLPGRSLMSSLKIKPFRLPCVRQLRFVPKGRAATWFRQNRPKIPKLPQARLQAVLDARNRPSTKQRM